MKKLLITPYSLLIAIIIIAAFLRLYNITQLPPGLYPDEAMNGNNALEALSPTGHFKVFYPENNGREGLFINIQALSIKIFGNEPWALRIVSALFGILTVLGVYFLAKELFSKNIALFSSFLLATSFWHINFSRIGFRAIMAPFFMTWALYFLLKALNSEKYKLASVIGGILLGLGFHSYIAYRAMPALIIIVWILYWIKNKDQVVRKKIIISAVYFTIASLVMFAPLGIYFLKNPQDFFGRTTQISIFGTPSPLKSLGINIIKTAGMFNVAGDWNWRHNYAGRPELFWPVGILFLIGAAISIRRLFSTGTGRSSRPARDAGLDSRPNDSFGDQAHLGSETFHTKTGGGSFASIILFSWLLIAALPVVVSNEGLPHALRSILMIPPVFILAGVGGIWLYEVLKKYVPPQHRRIIHYSLFIILFLLTLQVYTTYFVLWAKNPNIQDAFAANYARIGRELRELPKELPKYVIVEGGGVDVRGIPMSTQTVMFLTDTFTPEKQKERNLYYVLPSEKSKIPVNSYVLILK